MALSDHPLFRKPTHHMDLDEAHDHVHWTELFYDLVHVVTIFMLGNFLSHHLSVEGFFIFAGLFTALYFAWGDLSIYNSLYVTADYKHRLTVALQICTVMFMAAAIPAVGDKGWVYFACAFAANRFIVAYLYGRARRNGQDTHSIAIKMFRNFIILGCIALFSAFLPKPLNFIVFGLGVITTQLFYAMPRYGIMMIERFVPRLGHIVERFALLVLIVMGEGFFKLVVTLSEKGIYKADPGLLLNFIIGGISTFILCWSYFDFVGEGKPKDTKPQTLVVLWLGHLLLMLAGTMIGVALAGEVKVGFWDSYPYGYGVIGCLGLALYITMLMVIQWAVEPRLAHRFATRNVRLFGIGMALITFAITPYVPAIVGNLFWGTALASQVVIPIIRGYKAISNGDV